MTRNNRLSPDEMVRLDQLDSGLRAEADTFLRDSGLGRILGIAGFRPVGSYPMRTMTWRDLDFERMVDSPDWLDHWNLGRELAATGWVWRFSCIDAYRDRVSPGDSGYYWGLRASRPEGGPVWKLDIWTARPDEFAPTIERRTLWSSLMTDESRLHILSIKEAFCTGPEYRKSLLSVHIYEAVLERGITSTCEFRQWWLDTHAQPCP